MFCFQERCAKPEVTHLEAKRIFAFREQLINCSAIKSLAKSNIVAKQVHSNLLPSNTPTEDRYVITFIISLTFV